MCNSKHTYNAFQNTYNAFQNTYNAKRGGRMSVTVAAMFITSRLNVVWHPRPPGDHRCPARRVCVRFLPLKVWSKSYMTSQDMGEFVNTMHANTQTRTAYSQCVRYPNTNPHLVVLQNTEELLKIQVRVSKHDKQLLVTSRCLLAFVFGSICSSIAKHREGF